MSRLNKIIIKGYKSIDNLELELTKLNILVGCNGAGKSNFISFFKLLNHMIENNLETYVTKAGGANTLFHYGVKNTNDIYADLYFGKNRYEVTFESTDNDQLFFGSESAMYDSWGSWYSAFKSSGHQKTKLLDDKEKVTKYVRGALENWIVYHFHDTSSTAGVKRYCNISDNISLKHDASNLAAFLFLLKEKYNKNYENIVKNIQLVAPYFEDFILRPNPLNEENIKLEWKEKGSKEYFDANCLSDGTLRFICLATVLLQPNLPTTIVIDEPELGLHPFAINVLAGLIKRISENNQVIISTQSVPLINEFSIEDIITVDRQNAQSIFKRHSSEDLQDWLDEYSVGELWEKNILGGRP